MADRCITSATSTVYATQTVLSRVPSVTATATFLTVRPVVSLSTYIGTIRGQLTETVFRVRGEETVTATSELAGFATQTLFTSSPLSILYTTICPTPSSSSTTTSSTTTTTTTTTTPPPTTSSTTSTSSSTTTTPPPSSTRLTTVTVPFSSSSLTSSSSSATALAGSSKSSSGGSSHTGAIVGGAVGGAAALIALGLLGWWFAKKGGRSQKDEYDPFARDEHWDPALGGAGAAAGAGAVAAGRSNRLSRHGAHPRHSKYAEAGYGVAGAGAGALGYAATHERSRSRDSSGEGEKDGFPSYAPLPTDGSPQRVKRKVAPAAEQDAYYAHVPYYQSQGARQDDGMTMASVGTGAAGVGALGAASMYDRHHYEQQQAPQLPEIPVERDSYGAGGAMSPPPGGLANSPSPPPQHAQQGYAMSPPPQHNTAGVGVYPSMYSQGQGQAYGQPGGYMQYSSSTSPPPGAPSYPTMYGSAAPSYPPQHASLPYPGAIDYGPSATPQQQRDLAPPASLVPGVAPSPAPSYRSIQHLDEPTQQQQRSSPLRVVNEDEEQQRFGGEGEVDAYGGLDEGLAYLAPERR